MARLTVMTWNVQNLFHVGPGDDPARHAEYTAKLEALAKVIDHITPDVLALQEIGSEQALADLDAACAIDFDNRLVGRPDRRGIRVALLSPRRLSNHTDVQAFPPGLAPIQDKDLSFDDPHTEVNESLTGAPGRGILSATLWVARKRVTIVTCHLKSKLISYPRFLAAMATPALDLPTKENGSATPGMRSIAAPPRR